MLRIVGNGDEKKFTKNPRHFSMQNSQANSKKNSTKVFWRAGKVMIVQKGPFVHNSVCSQFLEGLFAILAECSQFCLRSC